MQTKYLDNNGLLYMWKKLKETFIQQKDLETIRAKIPKKVSELEDANNYALASAIPTKVEALTDASNYAKKADLPKSVNDLLGIEAYAKLTHIPKNVQDLSDHNNYVKKEELKEEVKNLAKSIKSLEFKVVLELPKKGEASIIYLVSHAKSDNDAYDEYIYINGAFEKIGTTAIDLTAYLKVSDMAVISNEEIDGLFV